MHIITRRALTTFATKHPDAREPLDVWFRIMRAARYSTPEEVRAAFPKVDFLSGEHAVFNIGGNKYRLSVNIRFRVGRVYVRHVMTHAEYTKRSQESAL